jgi:CRP-like cAMP-binding protein
MLINGTAKETYTDANGNEHEIADLEPGEFFGLVSLVKNEVDRTSIIATSDAEVIQIEETQAHRLFENDPSLSTFIEQKIENSNQELDAIETGLLE